MKKQIIKRKEKKFVKEKLITCYCCNGRGTYEDEYDQSDFEVFTCHVCGGSGKIKVKIYKDCEYYWDLSEVIEKLKN